MTPCPLPALACLLGLLLAAGEGRAEEPGPDPRELEGLLDTQVESASRYPQSRFDAPTLVHVTTRDEADALGHMTLGEMLARLPGLFLATDRDYTRLGVRGVERPGDFGSRVLITIDGLRINDPMYGQALPGTEFPLVAEWIKRVEFAPGPGGSLYGSNAMLGVVEAVTLDGADAPGLGLRASAGTFGNRRVALRYGRAADGTDLFLGAAASEADGERLVLPGFASPAHPDGRSNLRDGERNAALFAKLRSGPWQWLATGNWREQDVATAPYDTVFGDPGTRFRETAFYTQFAWDDGFAGDLRPSARIVAGQNTFDGRYAYPLTRSVGGSSLINVDETRVRWVGTDLRLQWRGLRNQTLTGGLEGTRVFQARLRNYDEAPPSEILDRRIRAFTLGAYFQHGLRFSEQATLVSGARADRLATGSWRLSPRLALVLRPDARQAIKFGAGEAFRAPDLNERYYEDGGRSQVASPALGAERVRSVQASWERALDGATLLSLAVYRNALHDLIDLDEREDGLLQYRNTGTIRTRGIELDLVRRAESGWQTRASIAWQQAQGQTGAISGAPRWIGKAHLATPTVDGWQAAAEAIALSRRTGAAQVPGYAEWNLALSRQIGRTATLAVRVQNVGDRAASDPAELGNALDRVPRPRRTAWIDLQVAF